MVIYSYKDKEYQSLDFLLKSEFSNVCIPSSPSNKLLKKLGISIHNSDDSNYLSEEQLLKQRKLERNKEISELTVEVNGKVFNADQTSQNRIQGAITHLELTGNGSKKWVLADNSVQDVTLDELKEAYTKALDIQDEVWIEPYKESPVE